MSGILRERRFSEKLRVRRGSNLIRRGKGRLSNTLVSIEVVKKLEVQRDDDGVNGVHVILGAHIQAFGDQDVFRRGTNLGDDSDEDGAVGICKARSRNAGSCTGETSALVVVCEHDRTALVQIEVEEVPDGLRGSVFGRVAADLEARAAEPRSGLVAPDSGRACRSRLSGRSLFALRPLRPLGAGRPWSPIRSIGTRCETSGRQKNACNRQKCTVHAREGTARVLEALRSCRNQREV